MDRFEHDLDRELTKLSADLKAGSYEPQAARRVYIEKPGTPQDGVISPLLANVYLNPLDHLRQQAGHTLVRYADDLVLLCATPTKAAAAYRALQAWVEAQGISLHPEKTRIVNLNEAGAGFDLLGYHFEHTRRGGLARWPRRKSMAKLKERLRALTHRANGQSLEETILWINRITLGWFGYFKHSNRCTFGALDGWIRGRRRAILRKRAHLKGRGRGRDHQRCTNAFFAEQGYFSLFMPR